MSEQLKEAIDILKKTKRAMEVDYTDEHNPFMPPIYLEIVRFLDEQAS